ncbi:MAG: thioredoxin domain-containing protein [Bryobacterales bacterium]|nr:thioredoxin domain-containing protein [Bryobacterales bacterium]
MHINRLSQEKSPYLLQHAHNPVDWYPWGPEAFEKARRENKPVFLSIGYSTCHWCHVMERESFENEGIAGILNEHFVCIKVDREERPDVDRIYMTYVQATTGSGGWPMSVWLTPDLKPFVGGTYFPPENRFGRPGFPAVLERIAEAWRTDRERIVSSSNDVLAELARHTRVSDEGAPLLSPAVSESGFQTLRRSFDSRLGGFGGAPKFPRPAVYNFLLRYWKRTGNQEALDMVLTTLRAMAQGGMNDQLGGGFHRYSVDARWFVPHFEKMLYDQAQLAISYVEAYQITGDVFFADTARQTLEYVLRDMRAPEGAFYSAEDADSVIDPAKPSEKGEGAFYIWTQAGIEAVAGQPAAKYLAYHYGVESEGNVREDPHNEFTGRNILFEAHSIEDVADYFDKPAAEVREAIEAAKRKLLAARSQRVRPHLDDKVLTSWNGLMISAFARAAAALDEPAYEEAAARAAGFVLERLYDPDQATLLRRYRAGEAAIPGFLDDYAFFVQGLLDLYEVSFDRSYLELALRLTETQIRLFEDKEDGGFFSSAGDDPSVLLRMKEDYDGAEPSGNSVAGANLRRLAEITNREDLRTAADRLFRAFASRLASNPVTLPQMLAVFEFSLSKPKQIILAGPRDAEGMRDMLRRLHGRFLPHRIVLLLDGEQTRTTLAGWLPALKTMTVQDGRATAYVCENYTCKLPVTDAAKFADLLQ